MIKYAVANGTATMSSTKIISSWWQGQMGFGQTETFSPTIAVDNNVASFTDPDTGKKQTDSGAGNVYIVATEENAVPSGFTGDWNPLTTTLWTSTNGGTTFGNHLTGNSGLGLGNVGPQREAAPKIAISQGTADGSVKGGTVTLVWDDFGSFSGAGPVPLDAIVDQQIPAGGATAPAATGPALVQSTFVRDDPGANYGSGSPTSPPQTHSIASNADRFGIGPSPSIASDNTLGSFSPFQGRIYVTYTDRYDARPDPTTWSSAMRRPATRPGTPTSSSRSSTRRPAPGRRRSRSTTTSTPTQDGYSDSFVNTATGPITGRPQFQSQVAVDDTTGTVAVSFLDTRYDAAQARVATTLTTSIDGGATFSPQDMAFADVPNTAFDAIGQRTVTLGPIPENQSGGNTNADANFSFGEHQGLAFEGGHLYPAFAANFNGGAQGTQRLDILVSPSTVAAGPRIVAATMGPVGEPGDQLNTQKNADGSPIASAFQVTFDRPVDPTTFNTIRRSRSPASSTPTSRTGRPTASRSTTRPTRRTRTTGPGSGTSRRGGGTTPATRRPTRSITARASRRPAAGTTSGRPGSPTRGRVTSPAITLPQNRFLELTFDYFLQTEASSPGFDSVERDDHRPVELVEVGDRRRQQHRRRGS